MNRPRKAHILLPTDFDPASFSFLTAPLLAANELSSSPPYDFIYVSASDHVAVSRYGWRTPARPVDEIDCCVPSLVVLIDSVSPIERYANFARYLRFACRHGARILASGSAVLGLARGGLLDTKTCSISRSYRHALKELYPRIRRSREPYFMDGNVATASGGIAALDLSLELVAHDLGRDMARCIAEKLVRGPIRGLDALPWPHRNTRLARILAILETTDDLSACNATDLAAKADLSVRQLDRLFRKHFQSTPRSYIMRCRLEKARQFLQHTGLPILDVATACGFHSAAHFTRAYKSQYDHPPSKER